MLSSHRDGGYWVATHIVDLTGLRPSPTRHAVVGLGAGAPVGRGETVTGGPVRCRTARSGWWA